MNRPHAGYTLIGMLVVLILLGTFLVLVGEAFVGTAQIQKELRRLDTGSGQLASALHGLRDALWSAKQVVVVDEHTVEIDGVRWHWESAPEDSTDPGEPGRLRTAGDAGVPVPLPMAFVPHPAGVLVQVGGKPTVLPSQWLLAMGGAR